MAGGNAPDPPRYQSFSFKSIPMPVGEIAPCRPVQSEDAPLVKFMRFVFTPAGQCSLRMRLW